MKEAVSEFVSSTVSSWAKESFRQAIANILKVAKRYLIHLPKGPANEWFTF